MNTAWDLSYTMLERCELKTTSAWGQLPNLGLKEHSPAQPSRRGSMD